MEIVLTVTIPVILYLIGRSRKSVSYKVLTQERLISVSSKLKGKLKILYEEKEVEDVTLFVLEIANSGNKEILAKDYVEPIRIFFGSDSQILSSEITEYKPSHFKISATSDEKVITLSKEVLNAGDSITLKTLVSKPQFYNVSGKIAGGKIELSIPKTQTPDFWSKMGILILVISLIGMVVSYTYDQLLLAGFFALLFFSVVGLTALYFIAKLYVFINSKLRHRSNSNQYD